MEPKKYADEPKKTWDRKDFDLEPLRGKSFRERAEIETNRDLAKPIEQLVCDFHDMAEKVINQNSPEAQNASWYLIQAEKRMVSMMARVALEHKRSSDWLVGLTWVLGFLTIGLLLETSFLLMVAHHTDDQIGEIRQDIEIYWNQKEENNPIPPKEIKPEPSNQ